MRVSVIGTGYVGLVTGTCLAEKGLDVTCVDVDQSKVDRINRGEPPIYERGLEALLRKNIGARLHAAADLRAAVLGSELTMITVGTPFRPEGVDLRFVEEVSRQIGAVLRDKPDYHVVVVKSTVVPGTTDAVVRPLLEEASGKQAGADFGVGMNPEFLTEGEAVSDFMFPDRIVIGGIDDRSLDAQNRLYEGFPDVETLRTNNNTAEMIKYASNALLATLISFSNELANLGAAIGRIDTVDVSRGLQMSRYLSTVLPDGRRFLPPINSFLLAGCGFGGSCLPKDVAALVAHGRKCGQEMALLDAVLRINRQQPARVLDLLGKHFADLSGKRVSILGLAFRPDTDDMRESPAIPIVRDLLARGARVRGYDPIANGEARKTFGDSLPLCGSLEEALRDCDAAVLVTRWSEFEAVPELVARMNPQPVFIDGRRMLDKHKFARYEGIGL
jgi:UDPglucose 6-dehydrogenase/GDP-mannose 6-dehydrogenase